MAVQPTMAAQSCNTNITSLHSASTQTSTSYPHAALAEALPTLTGLVPSSSSYQLTSQENHTLQQVENPRGEQSSTPRLSSLRSTRTLSIPRKPVPSFLGRHTDIQRTQLHRSYSFCATIPRSSSLSRHSVTEERCQDLFIGTDPNEPKGVCTTLKWYPELMTEQVRKIAFSVPSSVNVLRREIMSSDNITLFGSGSTRTMFAGSSTSTIHLVSLKSA